MTVLTFQLTLRRMQAVVKLPFSIAIVGVTLCWTWWLAPYFPTSAVQVVIAIIIGLAVWHDVRHKEWGFDRRALGPGFAYAIVATLPLVGVMLAAGSKFGTLHDRRDFLGSFVGLLVWGLGQQWVLQTVLLREAQRATSKRVGIFLAALIFGALHLPNPFLAPLTFIAAILWCTIYDRYPNVIPVAVSHALGTLAILYAFDESITGRLRVGISYLMLDR